jgi:poly(hydroxyalkanoate) granule-associated protein
MTENNEKIDENKKELDLDVHHQQEEELSHSDEKEPKAKKFVAPITHKIKESASQIWLAGLGAYAKAEQEGNKLFETLVKDGENIETLTREQIGKQWNQCLDKVGEVKEKATNSWEKIEKAFDDRVSRALVRLGIPSRAEVDALKAEVNQLKAMLNTNKEKN